MWLPDELAALARDQLPGVNLSAVLQAGLRALVDCDHDQVACCRCGAEVDVDDLVDTALSHFYRSALWELEPLVRQLGTAEGAARVLKSVAERHGVAAAAVPLPRPTRAEREAWAG